MLSFCQGGPVQSSLTDSRLVLLDAWLQLACVHGKWKQMCHFVERSLLQTMTDNVHLGCENFPYLAAGSHMGADTVSKAMLLKASCLL